MTIDTDVNKISYTGTGAVSTYSYPFRVFVDADLVITLADDDDVQISPDLILNTDYTVSGAGGVSGGTITLIGTYAPLPLDYTMVIRRVRDVTQETDLRNQGDFYPETHEDAFDHLIMVAQQLQEQINRTVLFEVTGVLTGPILLPNPEPSLYLRWNAGGTTLENVSGTNDTVVTDALDARLDVIEAYDIDTRVDVLEKSMAVQNLGITYAAGVLKITSADGTPLSTTNYARVPIQSATSGFVEYVKIISDASFIDDTGASDIVGEEFGTVAGTARTVDKAFYIYVTKDGSGNEARFISPCPCLTVVPALALVGWKGNPSPTPSDDSSWFLLSSSPSAAYTGFPCTRIGGFRMRKSSLDDWTVQTLTNSSGDGVSDIPFKGTHLEYPIGSWASCTIPSTQGFGTPSITAARKRHSGKMIELEVEIVSGTPTGAEARVLLPNGYITSVRKKVSGIYKDAQHSDLNSMLTQSGVNYVNFWRNVSYPTIANGNVIVAIAGDIIDLSVKAEITEWS